MSATTMDFFAHQDAARRRTSLLLLYYALAVAGIVTAVYGAIVLLLGVAASSDESGFDPGAVMWWNPTLFAWIAGGTLLIVILGTLYKIAALSQGGAAVARLLGGRLVPPQSTDPAERRAMNVVEEMALASGVPVPPVYVLDDEPGINAFAAGFSPSDAVIGLTRGGIERLTRDELQGVVAHEFSHILNGDMRLNIRLMGVLHGILVIALIGYVLLRTTGRTSHSRSRDKKGGNPLPLLGLALMIIGYIGVFFANLIKSAVSRQREFLADASAVQFTRNPAGLAGALRKIAGLAQGSRLATTHASEASHLFFGNALRSSFLGLLATHPPLTTRIRRLAPTEDAGTPAASAPASPTALGTAPAAPIVEGVAAIAAIAGAGRVTAARAVRQAGAPDARQLDFARQLLADLPADLRDALRHPAHARSVIYALLMDDAPAVRARQMDTLATDPESPSGEAFLALTRAVNELPPVARLPVVELAVPALKTMAPASFAAFERTLAALIEADRRTTLFEFALQHLLLRHVTPAFGRVNHAPIRHRALAGILPAARVVLAALAHHGAEGDTNPAAAARAFAAGARRLDATDTPPAPPPMPDLSDVQTALETLATAAPPLKKTILDACAACVAADGELRTDEAELLRAVADAMGVPMPPLLAA